MLGLVTEAENSDYHMTMRLMEKISRSPDPQNHNRQSVTQNQ